MNVKLHNREAQRLSILQLYKAFWAIIEGIFSMILSFGASIKILLPGKVIIYDLSYF